MPTRHRLTHHVRLNLVLSSILISTPWLPRWESRVKQIKRELRLTRSDPDKVSTSMAPRAPRNLHGCGLIAVQSEPLPRGQTGRIGGDPVHRALLASTGDRIWKAMPHQAMPHHMMAFSEVSKMCPVALGQRAKIPIHSDKCAMSMSESYRSEERRVGKE